MARTANVFARVEPEVKEKAEQVLDRLGIPMSNAVGMFLRQIVLQRGIPFEMKLPDYEEPVAYGSLTKEQFNTEIEKGMEDIKAGRVYSADDVEAEIKREFGNGTGVLSILSMKNRLAAFFMQFLSFLNSVWM